MDFVRLLGTMITSLAGTGMSSFLLTAHDGADVDFDLLSGSELRFFAEDDPLRRLGFEGHSLSERDGLTKCCTFFYGNEPGA
jgi:hypothetical protein